MKTQRKTQAERSAESTDAVLKAALALIARKGVSAITFEALGRQSGVSRALPGVRFGSKAGLIEAVLQYSYAAHEAVLAEHNIDCLSGLNALLAYVDICLAAIGQDESARAYFKLLAWSIGESHATLPTFALAHSHTKTRLRVWIEQGQIEGVVCPDIKSEQAALVIASLILGLSVQDLIESDTNQAHIRAAVAGTIGNMLGR